ncbi:hypothetical protein EZS27_042852 [termite gut metagenome]|uniref:Uncharacterized protein n=1 Tax=termite gut metagenome TaxID=433724 RepID=A0A5J4P7V8_9ZZZZ
MNIEELLGVLHSQKEIRAFKDWQIIYSVSMSSQYVYIIKSLLFVPIWDESTHRYSAPRNTGLWSWGSKQSRAIVFLTVAMLSC